MLFFDQKSLRFVTYPLFWTGVYCRAPVTRKRRFVSGVRFVCLRWRFALLWLIVAD
jgi:hypothetical protein